MAQDARVEALPEIVEFLGSAPVKGLIGGLDTESAHGETLTTVDPGSQTPLATVYAMQPEDVDRAVKAAASAFASGWDGVPYGGVNKSGVGGGVLGPDTLFDYWRSLSVVRPL
jgi:acyl-CoA reductase-like NAD-dependent aldehyde dehydrogenase